MPTNYIDYDGREVFVHTGISGGKYWGSFKWRSSYSLERVKSPAMPMVRDRAEAQRNLDAWAVRKRLPPRK